jgi:hypothetical protein
MLPVLPFLLEKVATTTTGEPSNRDGPRYKITPGIFATITPHNHKEKQIDPVPIHPAPHQWEGTDKRHPVYAQIFIHDIEHGSDHAYTAPEMDP